PSTRPNSTASTTPNTCRCCGKCRECAGYSATGWKRPTTRRCRNTSRSTRSTRLRSSTARPGRRRGNGAIGRPRSARTPPSVTTATSRRSRSSKPEQALFSPSRERAFLCGDPLDRVVAFDGDPVARAGVWPVVPHRVVLDAAVVPERDRVLLPAEAALEQWVGHVLEQVSQDAVALVARNAVDIPGEALVDVERLAAGHRMGAHHRVVGMGVALLVLDPVIGVLAAIVLAVVPRCQPVEVGLHPVR